MVQSIQNLGQPTSSGVAKVDQVGKVSGQKATVEKTNPIARSLGKRHVETPYIPKVFLITKIPSKDEIFLNALDFTKEQKERIKKMPNRTDAEKAGDYESVVEDVRVRPHDFRDSRRIARKQGLSSPTK